MSWKGAAAVIAVVFGVCLAALAAAAGAHAPQAPPTSAPAARDAIGRNLVEVTIRARDVPGAERVVGGAGGRVSARAGRLIAASVPAGALGQLSRAPAVERIEARAHEVDYAVPSEGIATSGASTWHAAGATGAGVKVAVIDSGFAGYASRQAAGELPSSAVVKSDYCAGGIEATAHGTAVAEIVHDLAPAAQLYLICQTGVVGLAQAINYAVREGIQIVNFSKGFPGQSRGDGTGAPGTPDALIAQAHEAGILWVNAAGNHATTHWSGTFSDADADALHDFAIGDEGNAIVLPPRAVECVSLKWDEWPSARTDFDLYLVDSGTLAVAAVSKTLQNGRQPPKEILCHENETTAERAYSIVIVRRAGTTSPRLDVFVDSARLEYVVAEGSLVEQAASPHTLAVGAYCWQTGELEEYSSRGPTIDNRVKPEIVAATRVSTQTYGATDGCASLTGFVGTSASAPAVAGLAALVKERHPEMSSDELRAYLEAHASDGGPAGKDNAFGSGRVALPITVPPTPVVPPADGTGTLVINGSSAVAAVTARGRRCVVPALVGKRFNTTSSAARKAGCAIGRSRRISSRSSTGRVVGQSRRPGAELPAGSRIDVVVSRGRTRDAASRR